MRGLRDKLDAAVPLLIGGAGVISGRIFDAVTEQIIAAAAVVAPQRALGV